jgi:membrane-bound lytic murein transglycosylase D
MDKTLNRNTNLAIIIAVLLNLTCGLGYGMFIDTSKVNIEKIDSRIRNRISDQKIQPLPISKDRKIIVFPDIHYEFRIENLDKQSPIKLDYNQDVKKYIDLYFQKRPEKVAEFMGKKEMYFPIFEEYLAKYNLPFELKYLSIVESGLDPLAKSSSGAVGLWQLLLNSSKLLGLEVDSYRDERCDPYLSTDAACRYLKYLYEVFNDWQLALAAYNGGPGEVRNAILRSGGKTNFWEIQPFLPEQTKWYVPAFIAVVYIANHAAEHGIVAMPPKYSYFQTDTLMIHEATEFSKIAEKINLSIDTIRFLNPIYKRDYIPDLGKPLSLVLPSDKILTFLKTENQIYSRNSDTLTYIDMLQLAGDTIGKAKIVHIVSKGDFLNKIAMNYNCTADNLRAWNHLRSDNLNAGQKLNIWQGNASNKISKQPEPSNINQTFFYYTVKKGDTMWKIAERFKCDSVDAIKLANNIRDERDLKPGQKLKILVKY